MEVVSEGSLESISRPSSSSKRSSSRSSVRSSSQLQGSLDVLPPEDPLAWSKPEIEEDVVITDFTDDTNVDVDQSLQSTDKTSIQYTADQPDSASHEDQTEDGKEVVLSKQALGVFSETEINDANLEVESETSSVADSQDSIFLDPKILKGLEKIKKLDTILSEKIKKEKEVKKQRREQERLWREHIDNLEQTRDAELGKQVDLGPAHMLALGAPEDTVDDSLYEQSPPVTPLFATQPIVDEELLERRNVQRHQNLTEKQKNSVNGRDPNFTETLNESIPDREKNEHQRSSNRRNKKDKKTKKRDFIKRNIMLAADANNVIAMTEEEKKRLEELLSDMNNLVDESFDKDIGSLTLYGNGFQPSQDEAKQLADIDIRLQSLLPSEEYDALCNQTTDEQDSFSQVRTPRSETSDGLLLEEESQTFGELVLQEEKEMREMKQRLLAIEERLTRFQTPDQDESPLVRAMSMAHDKQSLTKDEGVLTESLLRQLLEGSSRTTSQATTIFDSISSVATSMICDTTSSFDNSSFTVESPSPLITTSDQ